MITSPKLLLPLLLFFALFCKSNLVSATEFVGTTQCINCHQSQYKAWKGSHHDMAMRHATLDSVKGNFNNASINFNNQTNHFFKKGDKYWVNIAGPEGKFKNYQIKYTFGFEPLQQYMVEFEDGRVQLIPFAWDTRAAAEGGQRWFNLYPEQTQKHQEFFWTNTGQNWNYMCADCHSTNVRKNFDVKANTYKTTFSEINVGCEACHGPASEHIKWSKHPDNKINDSGFVRNLSKSVTNWISKSDSPTLSPEKIDHSQQTLVCAQCHSRRLQISTNDHVRGNAFGNRHLLNLIDSDRYYPDGQVYDEDYVYGSFLQSKMHKNGVVCSNCHDPHSAKLSLPEKTVCFQCHQVQTYANQKHHHHQERSTGAQCVNCHMPETTYMQVDARRDHSWHIPRPNFAKNHNTPDTCLYCHKDKDSDWSNKTTQAWNPESKTSNEQSFAPVFSAADQGYTQAASALSHIAQNSSHASIIRASALERMNRYPDTNTLIAIARGAKNIDENIRIGAIRGAEGIRDVERWQILAPLLTDKVLAIRSEAARVLMPLWQELSKEQQVKLTPALNDYLDIQTFNSDRGFAHTNIANMFIHQGKYKEAERAYKNSIRIDPHFANAYVNLAELYRRQKKEKESIKILETGVVANPDNGILPYSIGLAYIRSKQTIKAVEYLKKATLVAPDNAQFHYVYGLALEANQPQQAFVAINKAYQLSGNSQYLYALCEMHIRHKTIQVYQCIDKLRKVAPKKLLKLLKVN
ncbi:MAG: tetratricopeptide repeat protein [Methylococcaceae bacterium]|nr:tetratricopeptide repeat protein [Methylococcaceae bacterium]